MAKREEFYAAAAARAGVAQSFLEQKNVPKVQMEKKAKIKDPAKPTKNKPEITNAKLNAVIDALVYEIDYPGIDQALSDAGGFLGLAMSAGVDPEDVEQIYLEQLGIRKLDDEE